MSDAREDVLSGRALELDDEMVKRAAITLFELENPRNIGRWDDVPAFRRRMHLDDAEAVLRSAFGQTNRIGTTERPKPTPEDWARFWAPTEEGSDGLA